MDIYEIAATKLMLISPRMTAGIKHTAYVDPLLKALLLPPCEESFNRLSRAIPDDVAYPNDGPVSYKQALLAVISLLRKSP